MPVWMNTQVFKPVSPQALRAAAAGIRGIPLTPPNHCVGNGQLLPRQLPTDRTIWRNVAGYGDCFYGAISYHLTGNEHYTRQVRQAMFEKLVELRQAFHNSNDVHLRSLYDDRVSNAHRAREWAHDPEIYAMATVLDIPIVIGCVTPQGGINWTIRKPITSGRVERFQQDRYNGSNALYIGWTGSGEGKYFLPPRGSDPNHYRALTRLPVAHASQFPPTSQVPQDARPRSPIPGLDPACLESSPKPSRKPSSPVVKVRGRKSNRVFIDQ